MPKRSNPQNSLAKVTDLHQAKLILDTINWNFSTPFSIGRSDMKLFDCRKYHWYPATFIPEIPYTLIEILTKPGAVVYDPFGGIGTTLFAALLLGRKPYTSEISLAATEFMKSMWMVLNPNSDLIEISTDFKRIESAYKPGEDYSKMLCDAPICVDRLRPWYSSETFNQVMYLSLCAMKCNDTVSRSAMRIVLSAILKAVCAQDRGWGCIADNVKPKPSQTEKGKDAIRRFGRNLAILIRDLLELRKVLPSISKEMLLSSNANSHISRNDVRKACFLPDRSVDLIVTSPPYPNMSDYSMSQRLTYYWLGSDPSEDLPFEIGARRKRFSKTSIKVYLTDMLGALNTISSKVKPGGLACFVMPGFEGDNQNNSFRKQAVQECLAFLVVNGFILEKELSRILPKRRRHHNQKWTTLEREYIYIYRKI